MKARITNVLNINTKELLFGIVCQKEKGGKWNIPVSQDGEIWTTEDKNTAIKEVKRMNKGFKETE